MENIPKRQTAYKFWIKDLYYGVAKIDEVTQMKVFSVREKNVARVNLIGNIIELFVQDNYGSLTIDDGSAQMRLKVWNEDIDLVKDKQVGDFVMVIGRLTDFNDERYIRPEIVRNVNFDWAILRKLELSKEFGEPLKEARVVIVKEEVIPDEVEPTLKAREIILNTIEKMDVAGEEDLISACGMAKEKVAFAINELVKEGEIFSPKKGSYSLV
jgi:RPA family protein